MNVARELCLGVRSFRDGAGLEQLLADEGRRILLLNKGDICADSVAAVRRAAGRVPFAMVVSASREAFRLRNQHALLDGLADIPDTEWLDMRYSEAELLDAARTCRRRLLKATRDDLLLAMENGQFTLRYQPKVERLNDNEWLTREVEVLLRWQHPQHGLLGPLEFLPELAEFGLLGDVSEFVLDRAAAQLVTWQQQGLDLNGCINLASSLLTDPGLVDTCERILDAHRLGCDRITFEVAEQDVASSSGPQIEALAALRSRGFRISLDDFGIAAASLGTLAELPVDEIKIHPAALSRARQSDVGQIVLAAVTGLAHNLGVAVCAEGVEDFPTCEFLKTIECDRMQGFLISAAVLPEDIRGSYRMCFRMPSSSSSVL
ncbi:MAG: EAL domain-containing protein [Woeseia sp.]